MKFVQVVLRNFLLFFFLVSVFNGVAPAQGLFGKIVAGVVFGAFIAAVPTILTFFKLPVNFGSTLLMTLIISFAFFFLMRIGFLGLGSVGPSAINWGLPALGITRLDELTTLVLVSIASAFGSTWLESSLAKRK